MECGAKAMRKSTRPAGRTSKPSSHSSMNRHLGGGDAATVMEAISLGPHHRGAATPPMMIPSRHPWSQPKSTLE